MFHRHREVFCWKHVLAGLSSWCQSRRHSQSMPVHQNHTHAAMTLAFFQEGQAHGGWWMDRNISLLLPPSPPLGRAGSGKYLCSHLLVLCPVNLDFIVLMHSETAPKRALGAPQVQRRVIHLGIPTLEGSRLDSLHWSMWLNLNYLPSGGFL